MSSNDHQGTYESATNTHATKRRAEWPSKDAFRSKKPRSSLETKKVGGPIFKFQTAFAGSRVKTKTSDQSLNEQFAASICPPKRPMSRQDVKPKTEMSIPQPPQRPGLTQRPRDVKTIPQDAREGIANLKGVSIPPPPRFQTPRRKPASTAMAHRSLLASQTTAGLHEDEGDLEELALTPFPLFPPLASTPTKPATASSQQMLIERGLAPSPQKEQYRSKTGFVKGGLAELAQNIISRANTDFSLWSKEIAHPDGRTNSHSRLEVREILSRNPKETPESSTGGYISQGMISSVLTRCQTLDSAKDQSGLVLFSSRSPTASSRVSDIKGIDIGKEVHIWEPWSEATIVTTGAQCSMRREKVILCSRFMVK